MSESGEKTYTGGCHCGAVRFEVDLDLSRGASRCNCSICQKLGKTGATVAPAAFRLIAGEDELSSYRWGSGAGEYLFCKRCGVHSFGRGHLDVLGGDFVAIAVQCLDEVELTELSIGYFDGRHDNWMAGMRATPWPARG